MLVTENLTKTYGDFLAVDGVSLRVEAGQVLALLGPNGAGKTTTVRMLTSVLLPTNGWARVAGYDVVRQPALVRASVGILTEQHGLYDRMPADDYLDFFGQLYAMSHSNRKKRIDTLLEHFGLAEARKRRIGEYSKGMRQKLALARALLHEPPVLLLDEPTSAMDPESARLVRDAILALRSSDRTILICTHNLAEAEELADQIAIIRRGKIIVNGTISALKQKLLGPLEFEVRFSSEVDAVQISLPPGGTLTNYTERWLRYQSDQPEAYHPALLRSLLDQNLPVTGLQEVPRSLEAVYLQAVSARGDEVLDVR